MAASFDGRDPPETTSLFLSQRQSSFLIILLSTPTFFDDSSPKKASRRSTQQKTREGEIVKTTMASSTAASRNADVSMTEKQHDKFVDTVGRIVLRVNMVEGHEGSPEKKNTPSEGQGPLTSHELSELSLLCTLQTTLSRENDSSTPLGFANVEGDQLANLIELLDKHVNLAVGVQIIRDALEVMKKEESPSKASICLKKVS